MEPMSVEPPYLLAAQAGTVVRRLYRRVLEGEADTPADLVRTIGALRRLADDLAHLLPGLQDQLEDQLLSGQVGSPDAAGEAWDKVAGVGFALAQARAGGLLMAEELGASQRMLGELTAR
jgi:hypothetical protein